MVVDARVVLDVLLRTPRGRTAALLLFAPGESLHAPHLLDVEVAEALRRWERLKYRRRAPPRRAKTRELPLARYAHVER